MIALGIICIIIFSLYLLLLICQPLYHMYGFGKVIYHDWLGWHSPKKDKYKYNNTLFSECKYCSKEIYQDAHGFWTSY